MHSLHFSSLSVTVKKLTLHWKDCVHRTWHGCHLHCWCAQEMCLRVPYYEQNSSPQGFVTVISLLLLFYFVRSLLVILRLWCFSAMSGLTGSIQHVATGSHPVVFLFVCFCLFFNKSVVCSLCLVNNPKALYLYFWGRSATELMIFLRQTLLIIVHVRDSTFQQFLRILSGDFWLQIIFFVA